MKHYIFILILTLFMGSSCDILDKEPDFTVPENYYKTEDELQKALNGIYNRLIDTNGRMYSKALYSYFTISDESFYKNISTASKNIKVHSMDAANIDIGRFWEVLYEAVNRANMLLDNTKEMELDTRNKKAIKGETLFLRAYYYFLLTDFFERVPLKLESTKTANDKYLAQASLQDIYDRIVADMKEASTLVYDIDQLPSNERVSKTAVQAILARVYLKMAGMPLTSDPSSAQAQEYYAQALVYADSVIVSSKHSLNEDYKQIFINHSQDVNESRECLWEVGMFGNKLGDVDLAGSVGIENGIYCMSEEIGYSGGPIQITKKLYDLYGEKDSLRRDWCIAPYRYVQNATTKVFEKRFFTSAQIYDRTPGKWRREYEKGVKARSFNSTNFPVIRYSDVLLMKAEAENAINGPTAEAYDAINQVRRRAFNKPTYTPDTDCDITTGLDKAQFLAEIQDERAREFCFEGIRKHDLIRWGIYIQTMKNLAADIQKNAPSSPVSYKYAASAGLNTTDRNVVFPIPNTEFVVNKLIVQNKGW
ncbi:RagB/SusD family nutrient uptake outer membrane protein [Dysgonomonas sp. 520]|uniref:RagB/SusD family nutrient uptake outer membrane protein n=1 Tax=Dysgonomonas sp. 520 TaxID=2302931 RepID=UPI0013D7F1B0|nr:RagB/SusD family nutrient uptake outer membrane protein [Dysgonomonas sp. 520]NDW08719.1 RagB/SusD family nutrient uptake outer membrane protein [Dysgonomonas sp. 520]